MSKIINLRRWHPKSYKFGGEDLVLEVKMLTRQEAPEFVKRMVKLGESWTALAKGGDDTPEVLKLLEDPVLEDAFQRFVRIAPGQDVQWEGEPADMLTLYREASPFFLMEVMADIQRLAVLSVSEGKASGSPSGSRLGVTEPGSTDSAATSTASESGIVPSTATATRELVQSSAVSTTA